MNDFLFSIIRTIWVGVATSTFGLAIFSDAPKHRRMLYLVISLQMILIPIVNVTNFGE